MKCKAQKMRSGGLEIWWSNHLVPLVLAKSTQVRWTDWIQTVSRRYYTREWSRWGRISGISQLLLTRFGLNFKGKVKARSRQSQCKVEARLGKGQGKVKARSWQCQSQFEPRLGQVHGKVKERIRQGKSKVKSRSRGKFNNSNSFNEYQINFYRPQLTPYEQLQQ